MSGGRARQLPLALRYPPDQRLDTFVAPPPGAIAQLQALATGDSGDWLYLSGPAGSGKTHLSLAACAAAEAAGLRAVYLPLKAAAGRVREALEALHADLLAIDGLESLAGCGADELALFEFHNRARAAGVRVLYAGAGTPDSLGLGLPDLRSRLGQCARIALAPLDDAGRRVVLRARADRRGLAMDEAALDWLLERVGRDLAGLTARLDALDRLSLAAQRRITVPFLRRAIDEEKPAAG